MSLNNCQQVNNTFHINQIKDIDGIGLLNPIVGYSEKSLLPLVNACAPLINIVSNVIIFEKL
ncbi:hypothetical protein I4U23_021782 [Adineta vaga]|nr:hypothetical protein I4U23_021782 [Adineta vaga]